ncbi:MAG: hypothetical protein A2161_07785 [Candidatus Schekmanbacteria bacterium RBG_13_48_7]|uniref:FHA domain-containing protein n=1 Tax=Candidatus Schekmanbacteria bacterium RBG_13_48_7 TaxID=1817878 RepID=A0A1F7RZS4_9BACT|nr:MAG: hypothetical protein A2161_07785 [Candidatus Schekmanbacteria bacterium RBG_13_48_7]
MFYLLVDNNRTDLREGITRIGRDKNNDIVLDLTTVSRFHAEIHLKGDKLSIRDLKSTNGTLVSGKKITEKILVSGNIIEIGERRLSVVYEDDQDSEVVNWFKPSSTVKMILIESQKCSPD